MQKQQSSLDEPQARPALVRVAIPHFCRPQADAESGYGSSRDEAVLFRSLALARCLGGVLALARGIREEILNIADHALLEAPSRCYPKRYLQGVVVDCHVFVVHDAFLAETLKAFDRRIKVHQVALEDPRQLPHAARAFLLKDDAPGDADLSLYLEDDLVIHDQLFADKMLWFTEKLNHQFSLMPHRYELTGSHVQPRLFVDGPIDSTVLPEHQQPAASVAQGQFWDGQTIAFDRASNPHSGCFALSAAQRRRLSHQQLPGDGFIGPLETVATFTVLEHWPVMKSSWPQRDFLLIEHAHPSFLRARARMRS